MKKEKLQERILSVPPKKDITFQELDTFLNNNGFVMLRTARSAHPMYVHSKYKDLIVEFAKPHGKNNAVLISYVTNIKSVIEILYERENEL